MKRGTVLVAVLACGPAAAASAPLSAAQMAAAERVEAVTVPTPAEFFAAIDKISRPDWASFFRDPGPTAFPTRPQTAVNLGALVTDGYLAVEAEDGQQVKNTGKDIIALARALGVGEGVLQRGKSIADFADRNDWSALREELEATTNEVRRAMVDQRDEALASLIGAGLWLRALEAGSRAAAGSGEEAAPGLLGQPELAGFLRERLEGLPDNTRGGRVAARVGAALEEVQAAMKPARDRPWDTQRAEDIHRICAQLIAEMGAKP